ncbi:Putative exodeoxyribonuclease V gamma chain [Candidatus Protochlamydia naegleriophila]|uniref:RecBCD enzyme subunit RecC n=1 Tax=Candidatus Protochlamydia naegleriophila TaxID=389348 RepID=A0A0U5JHU5_9BACT|nr:exodeoxyribonuclease V subunit gamma [Candidatus Protochlamydia naegleriophila]CUI17999.1 Putative exodeoxyribonuclease V gamma chain [Candidatus Protochlamydia naegleriophila]
MVHDLDVFFSNRLSMLYQQLKHILFGVSTTPFKRRLVVVYGPAMKAWLTLQMAQDPDLGVAAGIEFVYLNQAFDQLLRLFQSPNSYIPSSLELSLAIEKELVASLKRFHYLTTAEQQDWLPLVYYLKLDPSQIGSSLKLTRKMEKRLVGLSQHLARIFQDYGRYAYPLVSKWEKGEQGGWQGRLWKTLFCDTNWSYPSRSFQQPLHPCSNCEVHFFSISFASRSEFDFLCRLTPYTQIYYYLLSPCAVFWSDIRSDKETAYLQSFWQQKLGTFSPHVLKLEELLRDRNPLLANFGRLGREMAHQIEESQAQTYARYLLPDHVNVLGEELFLHEDLQFDATEKPLTLLHAIQADMLVMRNPQGEPPFNLEQKDSSIQMHTAPTMRREVQILYHNLLSIIEKNSSISPSDIIVMAPQITEYVPYIQSIFGAVDSQLDFQILDLGMQTQSEIVQGFLQLLNLSESRWEVSQLLQLFEHRSFQRCHQLAQSDYYLIREWIEQAGIRWGEDWLHRNELLQRRHCQQGMVDETAVGTWDFGLTRLLLGLVLKSPAALSLDMLPCEGVDFSQTDLMGKWIRLLHSLRDDLSPLQDRTQMTMDDWSNYLLCLLDNYFKPDFEDSQSVEDYEELKAQFEILRSSARSFKQSHFSFQSVKIHLNHLLQQRGITYRENHLQSIRFCSLMPLRSIPAKVIALMGMQEGVFPRVSYHSSLNLMAGHDQVDYSPNPTDYDRYLFLEALQSASDCLLISHQGYSQQESKELQPSLVIEELFSYLNRHYTIQGKSIVEVCHFKHPFDSFDSRYFQAQTSLPNYSRTDYHSAKCYYQKDKHPPHSFLNEFTFVSHPQADLIPSHSVINLKALNSVARYPIKFYLNKGLEIYLQGEEDRKIKDEEELLLSSLDRYQLKQVALKEPFERVVQIAEKEGKLPFGLFKTVATKRLKEETDDLHERLHKHRIDPKTIFQVEFCTSCTEPCQIQEDQWLLPAVKLVYPDSYELVIVGKLAHVSSQGLVVTGKGTLADAWKAWPQFLLYDCAARLYPEKLQRQLIFTHATQPKKAFFEDSTPYLKQFVSYYALCLKNFSPLIPDWIPLIIEGNACGLQDKMRQLFSDSFGSYQSPDVRWILNKDNLPNAEALLQQWKELTELLAGDLMRFWYPSKQVSGVAE